MTGKDILKITLNLVLVYLAGGLILAGVYAKTSPIMFQNAKIAKEAALKELVPEADKIEKAGDWTIHEKHAEYFVAKKDDEVIGYVIQSFGKGYSSYINTLIAVDKDFKVKKINVLSHAETPGLGDEIEADSFKDQFKGKDAEHLKVLKTETTEFVQAISGATISSRAVCDDAVKKGVEFLKKQMTEGGAGNGEHSGHR
ncbi:MAG: RnfABCDGE type electron transport complex subunit G [Nitrospirae bacterium]|nr:RnfABCDGE type electron transport complex subunit G [Nitrospirota bacterium]